MAEFERICNEWKRMHETVPNCNACPLSLVNNKIGKSCDIIVRNFPETAKEIIMKWSAENPIMTNGKKFEEVFGFTVPTLFEVNQGNADWLMEEYKGGDK